MVLLKLEGVSKESPDRKAPHHPRTILSNVSFEVFGGEYITVLGPEGAGKSNLLDIVGLLDTATTGSYSFKGFDPKTLSDSQRSGLRGNHLGFLLPKPALMSDRNIVENVISGSTLQRSRASTWKKAIRDRSDAALETVGISNSSSSKPINLTVAEQQKVSLARAIASEPSLILAYEPTAMLGSADAASIMAILRQLATDGTAVIVATQDPSIVQADCRLLIMRNGAVSEEIKRKPDNLLPSDNADALGDITTEIFGSRLDDDGNAQ